MFARLLPFYFWYILVRSWLDYEHVGLLYLTSNYKGLWFISMTVIVIPIVEEWLIRYWLYGKNPALRTGFFIGFCLNTISQIYRTVYGFANVETALVDFWVVVLFSCLLAFVFYQRKIFYTPLVIRLDKINRSWIVFGLMCAYFVLYHLPEVSAFSLDFVFAYLAGSVVITYVAKRYGISLAILVHMLYNATTALINIDTLYLFDSIDRFYFYPIFFLTVLFLGVYHYWIYRLKKDPEYTPRLWFPN